MSLTQPELDEVCLAIQGFVDKELSFHQAEIILKQVRYTVDDLDKIISWMRISLLLDINSLNLLWNSAGTTMFVELIAKGYASFPEYINLLNHKIRHEPGSFSPEMLVAIELKAFACKQSIRDLRMRQLSRKADFLIEQPTEVNRDVESLKKRVADYGFPGELNELLSKIDEGLRTNQDGFDEAGTLKHIRTFAEELHKRCVTTLREKCPETQFKVGNPNSEDRTPLDKHQHVIEFLERHGVLTDKMKKLSEALYGILSNEGVHAITARREYVRLCRNMVIEYALVLFHEMDRRIHSPAS